MNGKTNVKVDIDVPEEGTSNEKGFTSSNLKTTFENDDITNQHYLEMCNKKSYSSEPGLPNEGEFNSGNDRAVTNNFEMNIKKEAAVSDMSQQNERDLRSIDDERNHGNVGTTRRSNYEMNNKIIKEEHNIIDMGLPKYENVFFSTDLENKCKIETVTCDTNSECYTNTQSKEWTVLPNINYKSEKKCFSSDPEKKELYNENGEADVRSVLTETECQSEVPESSVLQQNENSDDKPEDLESSQSSRLFLPVIVPEILGLDVEEPFQNRKALNKHTVLHQENSKKIFSRKSVLKVSNIMQEGESSYKCDNRHVLTDEIKKLHECYVCKKYFTQLSHLKTHYLIHEGKRPYECNVCKKRFTQLSSLKIHAMIHEGKKPHQCNVCKTKFTHLSTLNRHSLIHEGKRPYQCEVCKRRFTQLSNLKSHRLIHEGKRPYQCSVCKKSFTQPSTLKTHSYVHEREKQHECEVCKKRFTQLSSLKSHCWIHEGKKPHECTVCKKRFTMLSSVRRHTLIHKGQNLHECNVCKKRFADQSNLRRHSLIHEGKKPYECNVCQKRFTDRSNWKSHTLIHLGRRPHECNVCKKSFIRLSQLKAHILIHQDQKQ